MSVHHRHGSKWGMAKSIVTVPEAGYKTRQHRTISQSYARSSGEEQ